MKTTRLAGALATGFLLLLAAAARGETIPVGQTDDFNAPGDLAGWTGGANRTNVPSGGPDGSGYLQVSPGFSGKVGAFNVAQWSGDYLTDGITGIGLDVKNDGPQTILLRLLISRSADEYAATDPLVLPADSGWQHHVFGLSEDELTQVRGTSSLSTVLANANRLLLHHDPDSPSPTGTGALPPLNATIGIDNFTALPEPATWIMLAGLALGGLTARRLRARRRR